MMPGNGAVFDDCVLGRSEFFSPVFCVFRARARARARARNQESKTPLNYFDQDRTDVHNLGIVSMLSPLIRRADAKSGTGTGTV